MKTNWAAILISLLWIVLSMWLPMFITTSGAGEIIFLAPEHYVYGYPSEEPINIMGYLRNVEAGTPVSITVSLTLPDGATLYLGPDLVFKAQNVNVLDDFPFVSIPLTTLFPLDPQKINISDDPTKEDFLSEFPAGKYNISASISGEGINDDISSVDFWIVASELLPSIVDTPRPIIEGVSPPYSKGNEEITVYGKGLKGNPGLVDPMLLDNYNIKVYAGGIEHGVNYAADDGTILKFSLGDKCITGALRVVLTVPYWAEAQQKDRAVIPQVVSLSSNDFPFFCAPYIDSVTPQQFKEGDTLTISGSNFSVEPQRNTVYFNGAPVNIIEATNTTLTVDAPRIDGEDVEVKVVSQGVMGEPYNFKIIKRPPPTIYDYYPKKVMPEGEIMIMGDGFSTESGQISAYLDDYTLEVVEQNSDKVIVKAPKEINSGIYQLRLTDGEYEGIIVTEAMEVFNIDPVIYNYSPAQLKAGDKLTIMGDSFSTEAGKVKGYIDGYAMELVSQGSNQLVFKVPEFLNDGHYNIKIFDGGHEMTLEKGVDIYNPPAEFYNYYPKSLWPGDMLTITGSGLSSDAGKIKGLLGDREMTLTSQKDDMLIFTVPADMTEGRYDLKVIDRNYEFNVDSGINVLGKHIVIDSFYPQQAGPQDTITITGSGFPTDASQLKVYLGDYAMEIISQEENMLNVKVPSFIPDGQYQITILYGKDTLELEKGVDIYNPPAEFYNYYPKSLWPGDMLTITGSGLLSDAGKIKGLLGDREMTLTSQKDDMLIFTVPADMAEGRYDLKVIDRNYEFNVDSGINVLGQHITVDNFYPRQAGPQDTITITGSGFPTDASQLKVYLGDYAMEIISQGENMLNVKVPSFMPDGQYKIIILHGKDTLELGDYVYVFPSW